MQSDIEQLYKKCFKDLGWSYEPHGKHYDITNIKESYMSNGCFWCLYDDDLLIGTIAVKVIKE